MDSSNIEQANSEEGECETSPSQRVDIFPRLNDLPIPREIRADDRWPSQLLEMVDHIGAYYALLIVECFGGQQIDIPLNIAKSPFRKVLPPEISDQISFAWAGCEIEMPCCRWPLAFARRQPVLAAVREGKMTIRKAAVILESSRTFISHLVNKTDEGIGYEAIKLPEPRRLVALRQAADLAAIWLSEIGATEADIESAKAGIIDLYFNPIETGNNNEITTKISNK